MFPKEICLIICQYSIDFSVSCNINTIDYIVPLIDKNISKNFFCKLLQLGNIGIIYKFINQFLYLNTEGSFTIIIKKKYTELFKHLIHNYIFQGILRGETYTYINYEILQIIVEKGTLEMIKKLAKLIDFQFYKYNDDQNDIDDDILKISVVRNDIEIFKFLLEKIDPFNEKKLNNLDFDDDYFDDLLELTKNTEIINILHDKKKLYNIKFENSLKKLNHKQKI